MDNREFSLNCSWVENTSLPAYSSSSSSSFTGLDLLFDLKPLFIPLYSMVILVACSGNLLLLILIGLNKKRHNTTNFLIGNLALVDLVMCIFCVPLTASYAFDKRGWLFGRFMCHFVTLMQSATVFAAVLSLTAIAVDRYVVVAYPIRRRVGCQFCWGLVAVIWLCSLAFSTPTALHTGYLDLSATGLHMVVCEEFWHGQERGRLVYSCFVLLFSYFVPLAAVSASYLAISYHLRQRNISGLMAAGPVSNQMNWGRKRRKTFCLLLVSVLCFAFSWLPLQVVNLIRDLDTDFTILGKSHVNVIQVSCHLLAMSSACYNPFIYASLHDKFLSCLCHRDLFPRHRGVGGRGPRGNSSSFMTSHRLHRVNTFSTLGDIPVVLGNKMPQESWPLRQAHKSSTTTIIDHNYM
ncbi:prolactin releasing hormone 2 receptor [Salvelinus alpinus]|uniref:prolactin releasing hormone 2 receptor n=1 Tax=Salvelinus alpinus TaxID=8036 RepID=UPI0039FD898F